VMIDDKLHILDAIKKVWGEARHDRVREAGSLRSRPASSCWLSARGYSIRPHKRIEYLLLGCIYAEEAIVTAGTDKSSLPRGLECMKPV
jgi:hypothetical protein